MTARTSSELPQNCRSVTGGLFFSIMRKERESGGREA